MAKRDRDKQKPPGGGLEGLGGLFKGLGDLVEKLGELAEGGQELSRTGEITGEDKRVKGIYGFTVKVGLGGDKPRIEPFGNIRQDAKSGRTVVEEVREPVVDVFEEDGHVLVVAEMPGVGLADVDIDVKDDVLTISAKRGETKYRKEILLPRAFSKDKMQISCNNGVLEIKCLA